MAGWCGGVECCMYAGGEYVVYLVFGVDHDSCVDWWDGVGEG